MPHGRYGLLVWFKVVIKRTTHGQIIIFQYPTAGSDVRQSPAAIVLSEVFLVGAITTMSDFDPQRFLDAPIYAFDFQFMIGDVKDFLEFSESNIDWQHRRELQAISNREDLDDCPSGYRDHLEANANHRFLVSLPLRVRYAAVLALTTSVEWSAKFLNMRALIPVPEKRDGTNHTVKILRELAVRTQVSADSKIDDYEALVNVRNCIVHSAGLLDTYQFKASLPSSVARLQGFSLANWHFFGNQVCIDRGALNQHIDIMGKLVVDLHQSMHEKGQIQS